MAEGAPLELDVRVPPGQESLAERELIALGATVDVRGRGELRVHPTGPMRLLLGLERALAIYVVRPLPGADLDSIDVEAAVELAATVSTLGFKGKMATYRVTAGPEVSGDRRGIGKLAGALGRRLGLQLSPVAPDLILIIRGRPDGLELAARLPR